MAACATSLVADGADSEIVQGRGALAVQNILSMPGGVGGGSPPQPVSGFKHVFALGVMAFQTGFGDLDGIGIVRQFHQFLVIRHMLKMTPLAIHRAASFLLVTLDALLMIGRLEPDALRIFRVETVLMTGRTPCGFQSILILWPKMMTFAAVIDQGRMAFVGKPNRFVMIFSFPDDGTV